MNSEELAEAVAEAVEAACERVMGTGKEQYEDVKGKQRFEKLTMTQLLRETLEELDDVMVYNVMLRVRMRNLLKAYEAQERAMRSTIYVSGGYGGSGGTGYWHYPTTTTTWSVGGSGNA